VGLPPGLLWWLKLACATIGVALACLCTSLRRLYIIFLNDSLADDGSILHGAVSLSSGDYEDGDNEHQLQLHRCQWGKWSQHSPVNGLRVQGDSATFKKVQLAVFFPEK
jgi:hypothetical protein